MRSSGVSPAFSSRCFNDGWQMVVWACVGAYGALTLLRCVADEMAFTTRGLESLEALERDARKERNEEAEAEPIAVAEKAI